MFEEYVISRYFDLIVLDCILKMANASTYPVLQLGYV